MASSRYRTCPQSGVGGAGTGRMNRPPLPSSWSSSTRGNHRAEAVPRAGGRGRGRGGNNPPAAAVLLVLVDEVEPPVGIGGPVVRDGLADRVLPVQMHVVRPWQPPLDQRLIGGGGIRPGKCAQLAG